MSVLPAINAPLGVQLNRAAFLVYAVVFAWPLWHFRHTIVASGLIIFGSFEFCSLLGFVFSFIRESRSRWILAVLGLLIPATFWTFMSLLVFSRPARWEWPFDAVFILIVWMGIPIVLAVSLFRDRKTSEFFTKPVA